MSNDVLIQQLASLLEVTSDSLSPGTSLSTLDTWTRSRKYRCSRSCTSTTASLSKQTISIRSTLPPS